MQLSIWWILLLFFVKVLIKNEIKIKISYYPTEKKRRRIKEKIAWRSKNVWNGWQQYCMKTWHTSYRGGEGKTNKNCLLSNYLSKSQYILGEHNTHGNFRLFAVHSSRVVIKNIVQLNESMKQKNDNLLYTLLILFLSWAASHDNGLCSCLSIASFFCVKSQLSWLLRK